MVLDYGTLLSPYPIKLSVGSLRKPKLSEIYDLTFHKFTSYESFLKLHPSDLYSDFYGEEGKEIWNSFSEDQKNQITLFNMIVKDEKLQGIYTEILDFFFCETVMFYKDKFIILSEISDDDEEEEPFEDRILGYMSEDSFQFVLELIQQTCCIYEKPDKSVEEMKFKNNAAKKMYLKMLKAQEEQKKRKAQKANKDHSLPNLISAVSNRHPCINPIMIWDMTVFQLVDSFNRLQVNSVYDINQLRVSVWGDDKKAFDSTLWYKNNYD